MAWDAFREKNGAADFHSFKRSIALYRQKRGLDTLDPEVGCIVLSDPFFFDEADWIPAPDDWASNIVQGKTYDDFDAEGIALWNEVRARLQGAVPLQSGLFIRESIGFEGPVLGKRYLRTERLGQGAFRLMTLENYERKCCITGETTVPVLEAAHIKPVSAQGTHALKNGLLMRADMHILYDRGLISVDPSYRIRVSSQIRELYVNGKVYYAHDDQPLRSLPQDEDLRPDKSLLDWHFKEVFAA